MARSSFKVKNYILYVRQILYIYIYIVRILILNHLNERKENPMILDCATWAANVAQHQLGLQILYLVAGSILIGCAGCLIFKI